MDIRVTNKPIRHSNGMIIPKGVQVEVLETGIIFKAKALDTYGVFYTDVSNLRKTL